MLIKYQKFLSSTQCKRVCFMSQNMVIIFRSMRQNSTCFPTLVFSIQKCFLLAREGVFRLHISFDIQFSVLCLCLVLFIALPFVLLFFFFSEMLFTSFHMDYILQIPYFSSEKYGSKSKFLTYRTHLLNLEPRT